MLFPAGGHFRKRFLGLSLYGIFSGLPAPARARRRRRADRLRTNARVAQAGSRPSRRRALNESPQFHFYYGGGDATAAEIIARARRTA